MPRFAFDYGSPLTLPFTLPLAVPLRLSGLDRRFASVTVEHDVLDVRFGLLHLGVPVAEVADATVTGPYNPLKALGVRVSLADSGLTFGTGYRRGLCISFRRPVSAGLPLLRHPALTVTVEEPERLREVLLAARDAAVEEADGLLAEADAGTAPAGGSPGRSAAGRGRVVRDVQRAGTALEVVRPTETAVEPATEQAPAPAAEGPVRTRRATKKATKAVAGRAAETAASSPATPADMPSHRPTTTAESGDATKTVEQELAARRLAGNLPE